MKLVKLVTDFFDSWTSKSGPIPSVFYTFDLEMCFAPQRRALFDISTSKSGPSMVCFVNFDLEMCFALQWRALFPQVNFQKWSDNGVFCTFWLRNVLRARTARTFSTSELPKVVRKWCALYILTWKRASRQNGVRYFFDSSTSKSAPNSGYAGHAAERERDRDGPDPDRTDVQTQSNE